MDKLKLSKGFWIKSFALTVLVIGSFLFLRENYFNPNGWEFHREAANLEYSKGNHEEAEKYLLKALKAAEKFSPDDPRLHQTLNALVNIYNLQLKYSDAEMIILRMLALDKKLLGPEHANVAASLNNLAENYRARGLNERARSAYQKAIQILEKRLGPDHGLVDHVRDRYKTLPDSKKINE